MSNIFVGQVHPPEGNPDSVFKVESLVPASRRPARSTDTGCKMTHPA